MALKGDLHLRKDGEDSRPPLSQRYTLSDRCHKVINQGGLLTHTECPGLYHQTPQGQS